MKKFSFLFFVVIALAGMLASNNAFGQLGTLNGHEYVDLGLPSGTKWATCNVGANESFEYGDHFAWGETVTKKNYTDKNYKYTDNPTTLPPDADAATVNWGKEWRMPTKAEFEELKNNCTVNMIQMNGVNGCLLTGPSGNSIFLPASGIYGGDGLGGEGICGFYWSSSLYEDKDFAWCLRTCSGDVEIYDIFKYGRLGGLGLSVRPVCK